MRVLSDTADRAAALGSPVPLLSFFTGAGFLDLGFILEGFAPIWHNEIAREAITAFEYGMAGIPAAAGQHIEESRSIAEVTALEIAAAAFSNTPNPEVFGAIGGPPCPDFSRMGLNRGRDGRNGSLVGTFMERVGGLQPTFFVLENVPGLALTHKHRRYLREVLEGLAPNYAISLRILNALDYGIAQDRERLFVVGFRRDWLERNTPFAQLGFTDPGQLPLFERMLDETRPRRVTREMASHYSDWFPWRVDPRYSGARYRFDWPDTCEFGSCPARPMGIPQELMVGPLICNSNEIQRLPNGTEAFQPRSQKFILVREGEVKRKSFKRLHRWRYSPTAAYGNNEVHLHPTQPRRLTLREAMRIQSVPDTYALPADMSLTMKFRLVSNGVPVVLARVVAKSVARVLAGYIGVDTPCLAST